LYDTKRAQTAHTIAVVEEESPSIYSVVVATTDYQEEEILTKVALSQYQPLVSDKALPYLYSLLL